jgi:hypothetical protein
MKYYVTYPQTPVLHGDHNYRMIKVMKEDEKAFLEKHGHTVIASGRSVMDAIITLEVWKNKPPEQAKSGH